jgi:hypothetical protein
MLDYLISGANVLSLAGCFYVVYLIVRSCMVCARNFNRTASRSHANHELLFRSPSADYYI